MFDPLNYNNKNVNFLNNNKYSNEYWNYIKKISQFQIYSDRLKLKELFDLFENKQVILIISGTGSGKTVLIPKLLLKYMHDKQDNKITAITNPKILTTINNAEYGAKTLDIKLGQEVGYMFKDVQIKSDKTKLLYMTDGLVLSMILKKDPLLLNYNSIIIDEAHERQVQIDFLLYFLKQIVIKRPEFKVIIMSATINAEVFKNYYNEENIKYGEMFYPGTPNYSIEQIWLNKKIKKKRIY